MGHNKKKKQKQREAEERKHRISEAELAEEAREVVNELDKIDEAWHEIAAEAWHLRRSLSLLHLKESTNKK